MSKKLAGLAFRILMIIYATSLKSFLYCKSIKSLSFQESCLEFPNFAICTYYRECVYFIVDLYLSLISYASFSVFIAHLNQLNHERPAKFVHVVCNSN